jgi:hypothetical protein
MIPVDEAYILPTGTADTFITYFGPAERFDTVNTLGERQYMWTKRAQDNTRVDITTEQNFLNLIRRPACVVRAVAGASV